MNDEHLIPHYQADLDDGEHEHGEQGQCQRQLDRRLAAAAPAP